MELLVVVTILAILASLILFAMNSAREAARVARTKALIAGLDRMIMSDLETYLHRRPFVPFDELARLNNAKEVATARLNAMRVMLQADFPERWVELQELTPVLRLPNDRTVRYHSIRHQSMHYTYLQNKNKPDIARFEQNQGAECLWMITQALDRGKFKFDFAGRRETLGLREEDYVDTDGDGLMEIADGWGTPISFLRWPAGFVSEKQTQDANADSDPFDPYHIQGGWRLYPLIYSAGPDRVFDIASDVNRNYSQSPPSPPPFEYVYFGNPPILSAYNPLPSGDRIGTPKDNNGDGVANHLDNIHNHMMDIGK